MLCPSQCLMGVQMGRIFLECISLFSSNFTKFSQMWKPSFVFPSPNKASWRTGIQGLVSYFFIPYYTDTFFPFKKDIPWRCRSSIEVMKSTSWFAFLHFPFTKLSILKNRDTMTGLLFLYPILYRNFVSFKKGYTLAM